MTDTTSSLCRKVFIDGDQLWYCSDQLHREDGPAVIFKDGEENWYCQGQLHREDGPAVIASNLVMWYQNGLQHRADGPAVIWANGKQEWFWFGCQVDPLVVFLNSKIID
jgi:hypothetical protein